MEQNETLREIAKWNQNYERFKKDHNTIEDIVPMSLLLQWDDFSWETHASILHEEIAKKAKEDPSFEFWIRNPSYSWIGLTELMSVMLSNKGRLYSLDKDTLLILNTADNGEVYYPFDREWMFLSRAVAQNFVRKEKELAHYSYGAMAVRHINGVLHDNSSLNLEWVLPPAEVLEVYNSKDPNGAEPVQGGRRAVLISVQDPKEPATEYHQFVLLGNQAMIELGLDPAYIHQATTLKPWKAPFRARYFGAGEASVYPRNPPEFLKPHLNMLKSADQRVPESWQD
jgi:hypothetical protein